MNKKLDAFNTKLKESRIAIIGLGVSNLPLLDYLYNLNDNIKTLIALMITLFILFLVTQIPFIRDFVMQFFIGGYIFIFIIIIILYIYYFRNNKRN